MDHHHADVKTASKVRFAEPGSEPLPDDAPSPPLAENDDKDKDDKVNVNTLLLLDLALKCLKFWKNGFKFNINPRFIDYSKWLNGFIIIISIKKIEYLVNLTIKKI